ncbi:hypothetical protein Tco_0276073 [Tanacetum coccineum]
MTSRRPSILNRSSTQTQTELPTQEDQIRGYRQMARNRHQVARTTRRVFGRSNYNRTLETAVDPERQLEISRERRANLVPAEVLYSNNRNYMRRSHEDFQPLPRVFTKTIFTPEEPGALYKRYQLKVNKTPIIMDKSNAWRSVAQDLELSAAKEAVKAMRNLQAIIQCKAQICFGKSTKDNHWSDQREDVRVQNKEARRILIELEALTQRLGRNNI